MILVRTKDEFPDRGKLTRLAGKADPTGDERLHTRDRGKPSSDKCILR